MKSPILRTAILLTAGGLAASAWAAGDRPATTTDRAPAGTTQTMPAPATIDATRSATPAPNASDSDRSAGDVVGDAAITARVKASLIGDDLTKARNINVDTANAAVTLKGTVESQAEADRAMEIARSTDGVQAVKSELTIAR